MSIQEQVITTPTGRVIHINYPTPKCNPISPVIPDAEITRMDFVVTPGGVIVNKLGTGLYGKLVVVKAETKPQSFELETALDWCRSQGWVVRTWPGGARAWKHGLEPVRNSAEIIRLRQELITNPRPELNGRGNSLDLAYDL